MYFPQEYKYFLDETLQLHEGRLTLHLSNKENKTKIEKRFSNNPLSVSRPLYLTPDMAYFYLINTSGGLLQGDRLRVDITLDTNCRAHITTQAATKIYRMERNCAVQCTYVDVKEGSYLEYLPDANIPFRDSRFFQFNKFRINKKSTFFFWDILYPGRYSSGEEFENEVYYSNLTIYIGDELSLLDTVNLNPGKRDPKKVGIMGDNRFAATLYIYSEIYGDLLEELKSFNYGINSGGILIIKILEEDILKLNETLKEIWGMVRRTYTRHVLPPSRKY